MADSTSPDRARGELAQTTDDTAEHDAAVAVMVDTFDAKVVRESAALPMPRFGADLVPAGWWSEIAMPIIEKAATLDELDDLDRQLEAFIGFVIAVDADRTEFEKARRIVERRRGEMLDAEVVAGQRTDLEPSHACEGLDVSPQTVSRWRTIAREWDVILPHLIEAKHVAQVTQAAVLRLARRDDTGGADVVHEPCRCRCGKSWPCPDAKRPPGGGRDAGLPDPRLNSGTSSRS